jgi:hypothetical protein
MGFFKDIRKLQAQAEELTPPEHRGLRGGMRMMRDGVAQATEMLGDYQADAAKAQHLAVNGRPGTATIAAIRQTGVVVNENPQVELDLQVQVDAGAPYGVTHKQVIAMIAIPQFQPGCVVPVKVDPDDPQSLIIA